MQLTQHAEGSFRELLKLSLPLMFSFLSMMLMIFVDRLFLAHYSLDSLNASVNALTFGLVFNSGWMALASISEVFVAQYHGAGLKKKMGEPVWQMLWVSLGSLLMYLPLSLWGGDLFFGSGDGRLLEKQFFSIQMLFGPTTPAYAALCGFFIGKGKIGPIVWTAILANTVNACLDFLLIFGYPGWLEPMGIQGAALATSMSTLMQGAILFVIFISKKNRTEYGTGNCKINFPIMVQCLFIGIPSALCLAFELLAWSSYFEMMTSKGVIYITVAGVCQSLIMLFWFPVDAIFKATTAVAGNLIGAGKKDKVQHVIISAIKLIAIIYGSLLIAFPLMLKIMESQFLTDTSPELMMMLQQSLWLCLLLSIVYLFFEATRFIFVGALTAAGDTLFILAGGAFSLWGLMILPVYYFIHINSYSIVVASSICLIYSICSAMIFYLRFRTERWKTISLRA